MRKAELNIEKLKEAFEKKIYFQTNDIFSFYQSFDSLVAKSTIECRIRSLIKKGIIQRIGHGKYKFGSEIIYRPLISVKSKKINNFMMINFPYLKYIVWHIGEINHFSQHLINIDTYYVEVEKDAVDSVFARLREKYKYVLKGKFNQDVYFGESVIVVRSLVTGAPTQLVTNVPTTTIEKLLVDLFCDEEFDFVHGNEMSHIFNNAFSKCTINIDRMLRYASRKGKRNILADYIKTIN